MAQAVPGSVPRAWHTARVHHRLSRRLPVAAIAVAAALTGAGCADQPSQADFDAALAEFDGLPDEAKAFACADDWFAVQQGVPGFVLVERCGEAPAVAVTSSQPLSAEFERTDLAYTQSYYADNPPDSGLLAGVDADLLCTQDESEIAAGIATWREQTQFPSWDGVEFVPSVEHETAKLLVWQGVACPLLDE